MVKKQKMYKPSKVILCYLLWLLLLGISVHVNKLYCLELGGKIRKTESQIRYETRQKHKLGLDWWFLVDGEFIHTMVQLALLQFKNP